jgi:hypothetical protein
MSWPWRIARYGYAAYFLFVGIIVLLYHAGLVRIPPLETAPPALAFLSAMTATGYVNQLLSVSFIAGAIALLRHKSAPLGIAIFAPSVVGIFFFHVLLSGRLLWGGLWMLWLVALAWHYRRGFYGLWTFGTRDASHPSVF